MTRKTPFGHPMRKTHFQFFPTFTPVNHGSYGAFPRLVQDQQTALQRQAAERPDVFIVRDLPPLIDASRAAIAPLLGVETDEVVFVPNATTGVNVVLRNLKWEEGDVVVYFSTIYSACEKTVASIKEHVGIEGVKIELEFPVEDWEIMGKLRGCIELLKEGGRRVRMAIFDTVLTFPGARLPWEELVVACRELGVLSLIDGAHGVGHIDLRHLGKAGPDFFVSNCHKYVFSLHMPFQIHTKLLRWLYTPRGCAVFHVPYRNQHLIRTSLPTSHGYQYPSEEPNTNGKSPFVFLFEFVATIDYTPYVCVPAALEFRRKICGGEAAIRDYCYEIARVGGERVAEILETEVMSTETGTMSQCCFANVAFPFKFKKGGELHQEGAFDVSDASRLAYWINSTAVREYDTYLQIAYHARKMWVRLSGQIYLELKDFEWVGHTLKELCERVEHGEWKRS
jgi:selenocysteine lyase/cysteine desulfurase